MKMLDIIFHLASSNTCTFYQSELTVDLGKILLELRWVVETMVLKIDYIT